MPLHRSRYWIAVVVALSLVAVARAEALSPRSLTELTRSSSRIFRGVCLRADVGTIEIGGSHLSATTYTFRVTDRLKGDPGSVHAFRQVGAPEGGPRDLGRLVGLPVYTPGTEYVLFLLPESRVGLTSPAGLSQGAYVVEGDQVHAMHGAPDHPRIPPARAPSAPGRAAPPGAEAASYEELRRAVMELVRR